VRRRVGMLGLVLTSSGVGVLTPGIDI